VDGLNLFYREGGKSLATHDCAATRFSVIVAHVSEFDSEARSEVLRRRAGLFWLRVIPTTHRRRSSEKTIVIPGHGKIGGKHELTEYRDMLVTIHDRVAALKKAGKSLEEAIAAKPTAAYDSKWTTSFITGDVFTKLVYAGL
jgi:hypothetical protein